MKIGDLIECVETHERGTIISSRTNLGGEALSVVITYGIDWFSSNLNMPTWTYVDQLKVIEPCG